MKDLINEIEESIKDVYWCMLAEVAVGKDQEKATLTPCNLIEFLYAAVY